MTPLLSLFADWSPALLGWVATSIALVVAEIFTVGFFFFFFAVGAAAAAISTFLTSSWVIHTVIFIVVSAVSLFYARPILRQSFNITDQPQHRSNVDALTGERILVLETVTRYGGKVRLMHTGEVWTAYRPDGEEDLPEGSEACVFRVDGAKLVITRQV
ncbi:MAG: NfeD family protein [Candidatus Melainabacteria bacterium]